MKKYLTRDDVIKAGACADGVYSWANQHAKALTVMPSRVALATANEDEKGYIEEALGLSGNGNGNGYGYGDGNGNGYGNGYGNGDGNGNGNGNGYGNGYGDGYGNGDGDGGFQ